jgi:hypothetical protein
MREALDDHPPWMHGCPVPANGATIPNLPLLLIAADHTTGGNSLVERRHNIDCTHEVMVAGVAPLCKPYTDKHKKTAGIVSQLQADFNALKAISQ